MVYFVYDASFEGFLSTVFEVYERNVKTARIQKQGLESPQLFTDILTVITDEQKTQRVWKKLFNLLGQSGLQTLWKAWLSELPGIEDTLLQVIRYALSSNKNVLDDYGDLYVMELAQTVKSVGREKHRMEAFVRFQLTKDNIYYATIAPDFNVLPLIRTHFQNRYADQRWLIYDTKRKYGLYYDLNQSEFISLEAGEGMQGSKPDADLLAEKEVLYNDLWRDYFTNTNIKSRKNMKLHLQHVPKRYWKFLTEKL